MVAALLARRACKLCVCKYVYHGRFSILAGVLTNIGDIRSESVHDINKIRARHTGTNKAAAPMHACVHIYFSGCILFIPSEICARASYFFCVAFEIFEVHREIDRLGFTIPEAAYQTYLLRLPITDFFFGKKKKFRSDVN